jgi:hypothetical protein
MATINHSQVTFDAMAHIARLNQDNADAASHNAELHGAEALGAEEALEDSFDDLVDDDGVEMPRGLQGIRSFMEKNLLSANSLHDLAKSVLAKKDGVSDQARQKCAQFMDVLLDEGKTDAQRAEEMKRFKDFLATAYGLNIEDMPDENMWMAVLDAELASDAGDAPDVLLKSLNIEPSPLARSAAPSSEVKTTYHASERFGANHDDILYSHVKPSLDSMVGIQTMGEEAAVEALAIAGHKMQMLMLDVAKFDIKRNEQDKKDLMEANKKAMEEQKAKKAEADAKAKKAKGWGLFGKIVAAIVSVVMAVVAVVAAVATFGAATPLVVAAVAGAVCATACAAYAVADAVCETLDAIDGFSGKYSLDNLLEKAGMKWMSWVVMGIGILGAVLSGGASMAGSISNLTVKGALTAAKEAIKSIPSAIKGMVAGILKTLKNINFKTAFNALLKALKEPIRGLADGAKGLWQTVSHPVKSAKTFAAFAKANPSKAAAAVAGTVGAMSEGANSIAQGTLGIQQAQIRRDVSLLEAKVQRAKADLTKLAAQEQTFQDILKEINKMTDKYSEMFSNIIKSNSDGRSAIIASI